MKKYQFTKNKNKMENQYYRIPLSDKHDLEFFVATTNELNPHRDIKEMGVVVLKSGVQLDGGLNIEELVSLIKYLDECKDYIEKFNAKSSSK